MPMNILHPELLTPWQRFTVHWLGWQYARIWIPRTADAEGWWSITVRVYLGSDGAQVPAVTWTHYKRSVLMENEQAPFSHSVTGPARLQDLSHFMLTES